MWSMEIGTAYIKKVEEAFQGNSSDYLTNTIKMFENSLTREEIFIIKSYRAVRKKKREREVY